MLTYVHGCIFQVLSQFDGRGFLLNLRSKEMFNLYYSSHRFNPFGNQTREISTKDNHVKWDTGDETYGFNANLAVWKEDALTFDSCNDSVESNSNSSMIQKVFQWIGQSYIPAQYKYETYIQLLSSKVSLFLTACFLFFTSTTLVHFTLRETQEKMLKFTFLLQYHIRNHIPYASLIFRHLIESIVFVPVFLGLLFFIGEFFNNRVLAFMLISLVWLSEGNFLYFQDVLIYYTNVMHLTNFSLVLMPRIFL